MQQSAAPLSDAERDALERLLDALPAPLEPPDICALDGFLVGVLLQPQRVTESRWLAHVHDLEGRAAAPGFDLRPLHTLVRRRHAELERAIALRRWFDPWVFELDDGSPSESVLPWVAGFSAAQDLFPALMARAHGAGLEPLAVLYAHFDPDDLEDADELLELIETLEPAVTLDEAVEDLVRATLLLADVTRPRRN